METQDKSKNKFILPIIIVAIVALIGGFLVFSKSNSNTNSSSNTETAANAVREEDGKQIIEIIAKGGYSPENITAKAGIPTILRIKTNNTFDCSSALIINQLNISKNLPVNGSTDIDVPAQIAGSELKASCSMAMYFFKVKFV